MIKHKKKVKTWCFDINLMILYSLIYQQARDIRPLSGSSTPLLSMNVTHL